MSAHSVLCPQTIVASRPVADVLVKNTTANAATNSIAGAIHRPIARNTISSTARTIERVPVSIRLSDFRAMHSVEVVNSGWGEVSPNCFFHH